MPISHYWLKDAILNAHLVLIIHNLLKIFDVGMKARELKYYENLFEVMQNQKAKFYWRKKWIPLWKDVSHKDQDTGALSKIELWDTLHVNMNVDLLEWDRINDIQIY